MNTLVLIFTSTAFLLGAGGLRVIPLEATNKTLTIAKSFEDDVSFEKGFSTKVPSIDVYRRVWTKRYSLEHYLQEPLPSSIKMILGVFTVARDAEYRQVVRETWLNQTGVCYWSRKPQGNCSVYTAFVIGKAGSRYRSVKEAAKARQEDGILVLNITENMNHGKSMSWFQTAKKKFPWATHIAKMDMDTYPFVHKLVHRMNTNRSCVDAVGQYEFIGRPHNTYGPNFTHSCPYDECFGQFTSGADWDTPVALINGPWRFLSGEFYIMSMPLVKMLSGKKQRGGTEDLFMSQDVNEVAGKNNFCVALRRLDAWFHRSTAVDERYSNALTTV